MTTANFAGYEVRVNDEGFMTEFHEWNEDVGLALASMIGIEKMTDDHWAAINFLRSDFTEKQETPTLRRVSTVGG
ncbi:MAG: TusE/DsrC/DsvC family sulfur relay protein, partial [Acidimicrobiia bacterium]|nr:TusE/DsrC/DsvC family sulfur relay protein [Acidimicrobiia bacterium]